MSLGRAVWLVAIAGCYSATPSTGVPCDEREICPRNQVCVSNRCQPEGTVEIDAPNEIDAPSQQMIDAPTMLGPWSAPASLGLEPGISKTDPSFTPNLLTIVYTKGDNIYLATRPAIGAAFTVIELTNLNVPPNSKSPEITADGMTIYYASDPDGDYDIFVSKFLNGAFQPGEKVPNWSGANNEQDVAISPDELTAFVSISGDILRSQRGSKADAWPLPTSLGVNWGTSATAPSINANGDVYFHANATRDLFVARKINDNTYAAPVPVNELNTSGRDAAPYVSANDRHIMFERDSDIFESKR